MAKNADTPLLFKSGSFSTGANYWASHAGTGMWRDWRPEVVQADLGLMASSGLSVLRVFPLWPDFQPLNQLYGNRGSLAEFRLGEAVLDDTGPGFAGLDPVMLDRFEVLCNEAHNKGFSLIVGLITGWMSGRLFMPAGLAGRNPITDPVCLMWEVRFVTHFVRRFKDTPAIGAWDLGNECNEMGRASREEAWAWTAAIANAIRAEDPSRPIVSGMHSLPVDTTQPWSIRDQGELTDYLTTHPYPPFTPHAGIDAVATIRGSLHAAAETRLYSDIGRKPAFIEEAGILGPFFGNAETARAHLRSMLVTGWMEDQRALLWWCAFDQSHLHHAPYDWNAVEVELGLFTIDGKKKTVAEEMGAFQKFRTELPFATLPPRVTDAVCVLGHDMDAWGAAYGAYVLAAQAGLHLRFALGTEVLPDAPLYILPSLCGMRSLPQRTWRQLLQKVEAGATLYQSLNDATLAEFERISGFEVVNRSQRAGELRAVYNTPQGEALELRCDTPIRLALRATRAEVWAREADGNPVLGCARLGQGKVITSTLPLETSQLAAAGRFHGPQAVPAYRLWQRLRDEATSTRILTKKADLAGRDVVVTEHPVSASERIVVLYNLAETAAVFQAWVEAGWTGEVVSGHPARPSLQTVDAQVQVSLAPHQVAVVRLHC